MTAGNHKIRRARKEHACEWCGEPIFVGDKYYHTWGIGDDGSYDSKKHMECRAAFDTMSAYDRDRWCEEGWFGTMKRGKAEQK